MVNSIDDLIQYFKLNLSHKNLDQIQKLLDNSNNKSSDDIKDFLLWAKNTKNIKVVSQDIPSHILKESILHDIKVECRGPDDKIYDSNAEIRARIARGNTILEINNNGTKNYKLIIYALRKFTGGLGDEDDIDRKSGEWKNYFLKDYSSVTSVISLQKENGEAAHLSCVWKDNEFAICAGSKNVHIIFKNKEDLLNYSEQRYSYAKLIGLAVLRHLEKLKPDLRTLFLSFLVQFNLTVIFEILNPETQHVEDLSYLKEPLLKFITFTSNTIEFKPQSLCSMTPDCALELGNLFELSCVKMEFVDKNGIENHLLNIRKDHGYEGVVLYFLDSENNVIGLLKKKTTWYIILRAIREKLRHHISPKNTETISDLENRIKKRLTEIKKWIGFDDEDYERWLKTSVEFINWFDKKYHENLISKDDFQNKFPVLWTRYLNETNSTDKIKINISKSVLTDTHIDEISRELKSVAI
ncbi:unnamed protein product [Brachionus calyciflorus]|uniref:DUF7920 domain-containing protein n=1 Tax=Brachionus calyciflorus TaxID=104777 RepID=A0A813M362_9BILA|nr:unnamed protein product [Brachionus calyciflorus]